MFKAAKLSKVLIIGPKSEIGWTSKTLYGLNMVHVDDFTDSTGGMSIGEPLEGSREISKTLINIRRSISTLAIDKLEFPPDGRPINDIKSFLSKEFSKVEADGDSLVAKRDKLDASIDEITTVLKAIKPLITLSKGARFDMESLSTIAGYCKKDISATLQKISPDVKVQSVSKKVEKKKTNLILAYYPKKVEKTLIEILELADFQRINVPAFEGSVGQRVSNLELQLSKSKKELEDIKNRISELKKQYGKKILAAEEYLSHEVEKAELPLRCATTDNFFTVEGWVKEKDSVKLKSTIEKSSQGKVSVQILAKEEVEGKEVPVLLKHTKPVSQYQYLVDLYSPPNFKEIDPTLILALIFPVFFGLMIGDLGYGIVLMILGFIMKKKPFFGVGGPAVGNIIILAGFASSIFGAFMFADFFGIPFHEHIAGEITWQSLTGYNYPIHSIVGKLDSHSVIQLLVFSVIVGFVHMSLALIFGMANSATHKDAKHFGSRIGWFLILTSIFILAMNQAQYTELGEWVTHNLMFNVQEAGIDIMGILVPYFTIGLGATGLAIAIVTEGPFAIMESLSMLTNLISYTRLAAVGISKAGLAFALNIIFIDMLMPNNIALFILWLIGFAIAELLLIVLLGALSVGIQALRLHYVEFFMKFYEGGGQPFTPFGPRNKYTKVELVVI
ncbi:MAG: V-type ATP synthase subunit I [Thermoplasmata archaeon]|nr:V-type ATP synthase subunit I [Thermoplasmata archaeon]